MKNGNITVYFYDASGSPVGFRYHKSTYAAEVWDTYFYGKNLQGDITEIYSTDGTVLATYKYDAYGNYKRQMKNGGNSTTAKNNKLLYRGYYYDADLDLYYLNTRYYDPATGRFINADSALYHDMMGYNLFAYCKNNPINYSDSTGEVAILASLGALLYSAAAFVGAVAVTATVIVAVKGAVELGETISEAVSDAVGEKDSATTRAKAPQQSTIQDNTECVIGNSSTEIKTKEKYNPNPYAREGEKKQNRENRTKARTKLGWQPRNNRRDGKPAKPKAHTPGRDHDKYGNKIDIFGGIKI